MIALLTKLPWIAKSLAFVQNKTRLVLEYILIAVLVASASLTFTMWLSKGRIQEQLGAAQKDLASAHKRLDAVELVNEQHELTISSLKEMRLKDATALAGLISDYKALANSDAIARKRLATLENTNEDVRIYLNQRIPPNLACLLNHTCEAGNQGGDKAGARAAPASSAATVPSSRK